MLESLHYIITNIGKKTQHADAQEEIKPERITVSTPYIQKCTLVVLSFIFIYHSKYILPN